MQILGKTYTVYLCDNIEMGGNLGTVNPTRGAIKIGKDQTPDQKQDSLIHEVLHAISDELVLELEENTVRRIAVGLCSAGVAFPALGLVTSGAPGQGI
jgi:hypothetical protein